MAARNAILATGEEAAEIEQSERTILVDNSNKPFEHVWLPRSEDGSRFIHPLEKCVVLDFVDKTVSDVGPVKPPPVEITPFKVVQDVKDLKELVAKLRGANEFAVGLKHEEYRSFQGLTCLMHISTRTEDFIVDTLKLRVHIGPHLREVFKDTSKRKVMHGAGRDIICLQRDFGIYVCNMFDTEQASEVLKLERNSLEYLLRHFCEVAASEEYVREDTHYLLYIYDLMKRRLLSSSEAPLFEVYQRSYDICMQLYEKEILTENSYLNISGLHAADLGAHQLAIVSGLYEWRDGIARSADESTSYILPDKVLLDIAKKLILTTTKLREVLNSRHPYIQQNLDYVVNIIRCSMRKAVSFEPVAKKLKEEHTEMMTARSAKIANSEEAERSESISSAVKGDSFEMEVGNSVSGENPNHILGRQHDEYMIAVTNSNKPFEHFCLPRSEDGSRLIHPLEKCVVLDFVDKTVSDVGPVKPPPVEITPFKVIQDVKDLKELAAKLRGAYEFAVGLKHDEYRSFQGLTCLMHISTRTEDFIVDTLELKVHIGPHLRGVFKDPSKRKVMHGAGRDILCLQRDFGIYVCNMFDTEQASEVLKLQGSSLEYLLRHFCEVTVNKEYQNADWRLRPLSDEMQRYAREDTHYLLYTYDLMKTRLLSSSEAPLSEVYQRSYDKCIQLYEKEILTETSYLNISGLHAADLNGQKLAIVSGLYEWRDVTARLADESTGYILPDKVLLDIAKKMIMTTEKLRHVLNSRHLYIEQNLDDVVSIIRCSMQKAVSFEPAAKKLKEEHIEMMTASTSNAVEEDSFDNTEPCPESDSVIAPVEEASPCSSYLHTVTIPVGDRHITVETGEVGRQASGSVVVKDGDTIIYTSVCISDVPSDPSDIFPMSVHYQERFSAAGRTSGGYDKREGRLKDREVLICRRIDRPLRPTMVTGFYHETQIKSLLWGYDRLHFPDSLAVTAAGIAIALSEVPHTNTVAGVRVGLIGDKFIVNPTTMEMKDSKLDLFLSGSETGILMIEGYCDFLPDEKLLQAIEFGQDAVRVICKEVDKLVEKCGKPKLLDSIKLPPPELYKHVEEIAGDELVKVLQITKKAPRKKSLSLLEKHVVSILAKEGYVSKSETCVSSEITSDLLTDGEFDEGNADIKSVFKNTVPTSYSEVDVKLVFKSVCSKYLRKQIVKGGKRSDGRTSEEIRIIEAKCGYLPTTHGSALFTRGETQAVAVVTLGDRKMAQRIDSPVDGEDVKRFYLQYSFPPSCVGEVGRIGAPSRREIGHGTLAERALESILPSEDAFPYIIRVESTITESNGSSSMASVCGGCLALQDAGVPLKSSIAGIAMGLVVDTEEFGGDGTPLILSDITGSEDASGDMDFKVAGNEDGVTAFQMDIKVGGITVSTMRQALLQAKEGRKHILAEMLKCSPPPSKTLSKHAPLIHLIKVKPEKIRLIIGSGGKNVKSIIEETHVESIDIQDNGTVIITSRDLASLEKAKAIISNLTMVPIVGVVYRNRKITSVYPWGIFVEIMPGHVGLCRARELSPDSLSKADAFKVGDIVDVKLIEVNEKRQLCLSQKALLTAGMSRETGAPQKYTGKSETGQSSNTPKYDVAKIPPGTSTTRYIGSCKNEVNISSNKSDTVASSDRRSAG